MSKLICEGLKDYGLTEVYGSQSNNELIKLIQETYPHIIDDSIVSWCGIWVNSIVKKLGLESPKKYMVAREWLKVGQEVTEPQLGDIIVFWRSSISSWKGHVAIYIGETPTHYRVLGGNQSNKVCIKSYAKSRLLGIRRYV